MNDGRFENDKNENIDDFERKSDDNKNEKDIEGGEQKNEEIAFEEEKANAEKEEAAEEKVEDNSKEAEADKEVNEGSDLNSEKKVTADYAPPHYIPNFTVTNGNGNSNGQRPTNSYDMGNSSGKKKKQVGVGVLVAVCAICVILSMILGTIAGAFAGGGISFDRIIGKGGEDVKIIRSNREITVEELEGETGHSNMSVAQVAAYIGENVVEITTTHVKTNSIYGQYITSGAGSGVVFDQSDTGYTYIVTNYHVISGADEISVRIKNGDKYNDYKAEYIAGDAAEDIAVIGIQYVEQSFRELVFAQSDKLLVGEQVVAIGNPLGQLGGTVTDGIISALDREIIIENNTMTLLQTNAAINPGNSGGGLFNMSGELVGIVNAKQSSSGIEGLGFAIPSDVVYKNIHDILEYGYVRGRITLGITVQYGTYMMNTGVFVTDAGVSGFNQFDRIVRINDKQIETLSDYNAALKTLSVGESVTVTVARNGAFKEIGVTAMENTSKY